MSVATAAAPTKSDTTRVKGTVAPTVLQIPSPNVSETHDPNVMSSAREASKPENVSCT